MINPSDPAYPHEGHRYIVEKDLIATLGPELGAKIAAIDHRYQGMTIRDEFAARAMQGLISSYHLTPSLGRENFDVIAQAAQEMADAMIRALNKEVPPWK